MAHQGISGLYGGEGKLTLASADGFQVVVMPVASNRANEQQRADNEAKGEAEDIAEPIDEAEASPTQRQSRSSLNA